MKSVKQSLFQVLCLLCLAASLESLDPKRPLHLYVQNYWGLEEGLPQLSIMASIQTRGGYLYFATQEGLARFNGRAFTVYDQYNTAEILRNYIRCLLEDKNGDLWIGTDGGGLSRLRGGVFRAFKREHGLSGLHIASLLENPDGSIWIGTYEHWINILKNDRITGLPLPPGLSGMTALSMIRDSLGDVWIGTESAGLFRWRDGVFIHFGVEHGLPAQYISTLLEDSDNPGEIWVGTATHGLFSYKNQHFFPVNAEAGLRAKHINCLLRDRDGNLWIGSEGEGLHRLTAGKALKLKPAPNHTVGTVYSLYEDREHNLWVGTNGDGLVRLKDGVATVLDTDSGLSKDAVFCTLEASDGDIYVGTAGGGLNRIRRDGSVKVYTTDDGLVNNNMFSICEDRHKAIWIGTFGNGLCRMKDGKFKVYDQRHGLGKNFIWSVYADSRDNIWVGTMGGGLFRFSEGKFYGYDTRSGLGNDRVVVIKEDSRGDIWVGTYGGGLNQIRDNCIINHLTKKDGLPDNIIMSIYEDGDGALWIGTDGGGICRYKKGRFVSITRKEGLLDNLAYQILEDNYGNLWMSCNLGIYCISRKVLNDFCDGRWSGKIPISVFGISDGMKTVECNGVCQPAGMKTRDGRIWFPTQRGLTVIDPALMNRKSPPPPVIIEKIVIDSRELDPRFFKTGHTLKPGSKSIEIHYAGLTYSAPLKVRYRYKLENHDEDWVDAESRQTAYFNTLRPGSYRFIVAARNGDGAWSPQPATFSLELKPRFRETFWFHLLVAFVGLSTIFGLYRLRVRSLKKREEQLALLVEQRTDQLTRANRELEKQRVAAESANMAKTEFLARMSHEIRTPMNSIIGFTEMLQDSNLNEEQLDYARTISRSGESLVSILDDIMDLSKIEAGELKLSPIDFDPEMTAYDICDMVIPRIDPHLVEILCSTGDTTPPFVRQDPGRFRQVLINLMGNAAKFTQRGEIELSIEADLETAQDIRLHCRVRDTGIGIRLEKHETIFEVFQQADGSITREYGGAGLGLAICRQIARLMGGDIWVESEPGRGSTFHFTAWAKKSPLKPTRELPFPSLAEKKVLIVDDNARCLTLTKNLLTRYHMRVFTLRRGDDAAPAIREHHLQGDPFDICILDTLLPYISGYEASSRIRRLESPLNALPLIACSPAPLRYPSGDGKNSFNGHLAKPARPDKLLKMICRLLTPEECRTALPMTSREPGIIGEQAPCILLVEDNPVNQKLACTLLGKAGYQVDLAENGREAVEIFTATPDKYDIILMDIQMPKMDGKEAARIIRSAGHTAIPIIAMTAESMKGDREKCLEAGMNDYIPKPIKRDIVLAMLRKFLHPESSSPAAPAGAGRRTD